MHACIESGTGTLLNIGAIWESWIIIIFVAECTNITHITYLVIGISNDPVSC